MNGIHSRNGEDETVPYNNSRAVTKRYTRGRTRRQPDKRRIPPSPPLQKFPTVKNVGFPLSDLSKSPDVLSTAKSCGCISALSRNQCLVLLNQPPSKLPFPAAYLTLLPFASDPGPTPTSYVIIARYSYDISRATFLKR